MRYQNPSTDSMAHYWEENVATIWGSWLTARKNSQRLLNLFISEIIFSNLYLAYYFVVSQLSLSHNVQIVRSIASRVHLGTIAKRSIDIAGAIMGIIISLPIWLMIPIAIKLDSRGPIFYRQERVGQNRRRRNRRTITLEGAERRSESERRANDSYGKPFMIIKFRTMRQDAEKLSGPTWASKNDPRVTRLGRLMRATRIDEIPQLFNVLQGEMSLVGPRPERPFFVSKLTQTIDNYSYRFHVKPGITGLAQVEHKYDESIEDVSNKIKYDVKYIRNWSVIQDLRIIMKTVMVVLTARGM